MLETGLGQSFLSAHAKLSEHKSFEHEKKKNVREEETSVERPENINVHKQPSHEKLEKSPDWVTERREGGG